MKLSNSVSLDLVICTYNNALLLDRVLHAIAGQRVPPFLEWGCLIIDNNCDDDTATIVEKHIMSGRIPDLRVRIEKKQGLTPARLCGFKSSTRDWIAFIDDDCILNEDWLAEADKFLRSNAACGAFGGQVILDWEVKPPTYILKYGYSFAEQNLGVQQFETDFLVGAGLVVRKTALSASGWPDKQLLRDRVGSKLLSGGDVEIVLRIRSAGYSLWYIPKCKVRHIIPQRRTTRKYLISINYNLGISQLYADAMVWKGSYSSWRDFTFHGLLESLKKLPADIYQISIGKKFLIDVAVNYSFLFGKFSGFWKMLRKKNDLCTHLLGCAK